MLKLTTDKHEASRGLSATAELFVNFNIVAPVVSEILAGPKFMLWGRVPPIRPIAENFFCTQGE